MILTLQIQIRLSQIARSCDEHHIIIVNTFCWNLKKNLDTIEVQIHFIVILKRSLKATFLLISHEIWFSWGKKFY